MKNRKPIQVIYPEQNARLWIPRDFDGKLQAVTFRVVHRDRGGNVYWYIDDVYKGTTTNLHKKRLRPIDGQHRLEVIEQSGNRAQRKFQISYVK